MAVYLVNPLSPVGQCSTADDVARLIANIVKCIDRLLPALIAGRYQLLLDAGIYQRQIIPDIVLVTALASLHGSEGRDVRNKWYLYMKSRAKKVLAPELDLVMRSRASGVLVNGNASADILNEGVHLLSFGGCEVMEAQELEISSAIKTRTASNAHNLEGLERLLPQYEAHEKKHGAKAYFDAARGVDVSPMTLPDNVAREVLIAGIPNGKEYYGLHKPSQKLVCFKNTGGNVYHGYEVEAAAIPAGILSQLRA